MQGVPMKSPRRVIVNTDAKNEADDQFAIVHALFSPSLDVRGLIPAHFGTARSSRSMLDSRDEIDLLLRLMGLEGKVTVANGAADAIPDEATPQDSPGARLIIEEVVHAGHPGHQPKSTGRLGVPHGCLTILSKSESVCQVAEQGVGGEPRGFHRVLGILSRLHRSEVQTVEPDLDSLEESDRLLRRGDRVLTERELVELPHTVPVVLGQDVEELEELHGMY